MRTGFERSENSSDHREQMKKKLEAKAEIEKALSVPPPEDATPRAEAIPLTVVYEDDDLIVIDKPVGLVVHPSATTNADQRRNLRVAEFGQQLRPGLE